MSYCSNIFLIIIVTFFQYGASKTNSIFDCTVQSHTSLIKFNFTELPDANITFTGGELPRMSIRVRLCSPLPEKCNGLDGYSICSSFGNKTKGLGKAPPLLTIEEGRLQFKFTGDLCNATHNWTVLIIMQCDYDAKINTRPQPFPHFEGQCIIHMIWATIKACGPLTKSKCTITDSAGNHYNLTSLIGTSSNYVIPFDKNVKMILNVCRNVIHEYGATCAQNSSACLQDSTDPKNVEYRNFGNVPTSLEFDDNTIVLKYKGGDMCEIVGDNHETTIFFKCDPEAEDSGPEYVSETLKTCDHRILWKTPAACDETVLRQYSEANAGRCKVLNPIKKFEYNLQSLMDQDFSANAPDGTRYTFRVCAPLVDGRCEKGTGICHRKNSTSAGLSNSNLMWQFGGPYLNYTDGETCGNGQRRYTVIAFFCGVEGSDNSPIIMEDKPCYVIIHWNTDLACDERRIKCTTENDQINLAPLIRRTKNYVVKVGNGTEFHINVCRPLVTTQDLTCAHGSAVCQTVLNSKGQYTKEISLGFPDERPKFVASNALNNQSATLDYHSLGPCLEKPGQNVSSSFKFICDYDSDMGAPEYEGYSNCIHNFKWKTRRVCGAAMEKWIPPCTISNNLPHPPQKLDLSPLHQQPIYTVVSNTGKQYRLSVCGGANFCNGSAVCEGINGYGSKVDVVYDYNRDMIKLKYSEGSKCQHQFYESELRLTCNSSIGIGEPKLGMETNCSAIFDWETSVACIDNLSISVEISKPSYSSVQGVAIAVTLIVVLVVTVIFIFMRNPQRFTNLRSRVRALTARKNHSRFRYSRVDTTEEARLLETSELYVDCEVESDDELLGA